MKRFLIFGFLMLSFFYGCDKVTEKTNVQYVAKIVGFDLNCNTCIVSFPYDSLAIKESLGKSPDNYYRLVNLYQSNYVIGQKLIVEVRNAEGSELKECVPLEVVRFYNYVKLFALDIKKNTNFMRNDTLVLAYKDCLFDKDGQSYICLDSVLTDSRCPLAGECFWAGEAIARFKIEKYNHSPVFIDIKEGTNDVSVSDYHLSFLKLSPYPSINYSLNQQDYKASVLIN